MFTKAEPIWIKNRSREMNTYAVFRAQITDAGNTKLHIAGTTFYRIYVNQIRPLGLE